MKRRIYAGHTPALRLATVFGWAALTIFLAAILATRQPSLSHSLEAGTLLRSDRGELTLTPLDLLPEPGEITDDGDLRSFYERQDTLTTILKGQAMTITQGSQTLPLTTQPRSLADVPALFWIQLIVGAGALLISGWVWALKPRDLASRLFVLSGLATWMFTFSAALYTTRASALAASFFQSLVALNMLGASLFGISTLALFLVYPLRLTRWRGLALTQAGFFAVWTLLSIMKLMPAWAGVNLVTLIEMLGICLAIAAQYVATKQDPKARAAMKWLGLSVLVGAGAFIGLNAVPLVLKKDATIEQGYAFLFFLLIYVGIAAGLRRYRLFDVGQWAYRFLFYAVGAIFLVLLDAALLFLVGWERLPALGTALLTMSFLYLPLRDVIWQRLGRRGVMEPHKLLSEALHVAFAPSSTERSSRWEALLKRVFDPLEIVAADSPVRDVTIIDDGLSILLPPVASTTSLRMSYPWSGRALFNNEFRELAHQFVLLIQQAESSREAYERGVSVERKRMAQDLHDDIGARLLTSLYMADDSLKPTLQAALADIRDIVSESSDEEITLSRLIADARHETAQRLSAANIALDWPLADCEKARTKLLDAQQHKAIRSALREAVSNVIRHSKASGLTVKLVTNEEALDLLLSDDGQGFVMKEENQGHGLKNMRRRLEAIGGTFRLESHSKGSSVHLYLPLSSSPHEQGMKALHH